MKRRNKKYWIVKNNNNKCTGEDSLQLNSWQWNNISYLELVFASLGSRSSAVEGAVRKY